MNNAENKAIAIVRKQRVKKFIPLPILIGIVTALFTLSRITHNGMFLAKWLPFYGLALVLIAPVAILLLTKFTPFVNKILDNSHAVIQGLAFAIPAFSIIGTLMTGLAVFLFNDIETLKHYFTLWGHELQSKIPLFLTIALIIGGIVKPLIGRKSAKI